MSKLEKKVPLIHSMKYRVDQY